MMIIIEGPDLAGKTTLAEKLEEQLIGKIPVLRRHAGPLDQHPIDAYARPVLETPRDVMQIADRWHLGELVYGPLLRGKSAFTVAQWRWVELMLASRGAVTTVLFPPRNVLIERFAMRGDALITLEQLEVVYDAYEKLRASPHAYHRFAHPSITYVDLKPTASESLIQISTARARKLREINDSCPSYIGTSSPSVLIVGDEPGFPVEGHKPLPIEMPFVPWSSDDCGSYLLEALPAGEWSGIGLVNSRDVDCQQLWRQLDRPPTVALGRKAHERLIKQSVPHGSVAHPQWERDFKPYGQRGYGFDVLEAARTERFL